MVLSHKENTVLQLMVLVLISEDALNHYIFPLRLFNHNWQVEKRKIVVV